MVIVKIKCKVLAQAMQKYSTLRIYMKDFQQNSNDANIFISKAEDSFIKEDGTYDKNSLDFYLSLLDWAFNEQSQYSGKDNDEGYPIMEPGDAKKFYEEHPEGFQWAYLKVVKL